MAAEARPVVHVHQQFGDLDARQQMAGLVDQRLRGIGHRGIQRGDLQPGLGEDGIGQLVVLGQAGDGGQLLVQQLQALFQVLVAVRVDRQGQSLRMLERGEPLCRQQVVVEVAELPRALDPDVTGAQRVLQLGQGADFVEAPVEAFRGYH
ncbi:hypothetical protein Z046_21835 [Pseudomonas aeruginosa VRFPA09]|nr:hypothetical protein Z046_21835 [Pseudomonas aeruginosa VRFPA09]